MLALSQADLIQEYDSHEEAEAAMEEIGNLEPQLREDLGVVRFENGKRVGEPIRLRIYA